MIPAVRGWSRQLCSVPTLRGLPFDPDWRRS
jgi:hypothetical protein